MSQCGIHFTNLFRVKQTSFFHNV